MSASIARWARWTSIPVLVLAAGIWSWYLVDGTPTSENADDDFWALIAALAATLAIAYAVTISDALHTYHDMRDREGVERTWRVTVSFIGGALGAFFVVLQAVATFVAVWSILDGKPHAWPYRVGALEVAAVGAIAIVPFFAHAWFPGKEPTGSTDRAKGESKQDNPRHRS